MARCSRGPYARELGVRFYKRDYLVSQEGLVLHSGPASTECTIRVYIERIQDPGVTFSSILALNTAFVRAFVRSRFQMSSSFYFDSPSTREPTDVRATSL